MSSDRSQKLLAWLKAQKIATMKRMRHQFRVSHMTVFRILKEHGYYTSYNCNAAYYTLRETPRFDDTGLWEYHNARFSQFGSLNDTIVALVKNAAAGCTVRELEDRLHVQAANLLSRLVRHGRLTQRRLQAA